MDYLFFIMILFYSFKTPDIESIGAKNISSACLLSADRIALATNLGGCAIIDKQGKFIQRFTKKEGIQNNNVLSVMMDKDKNLWLGLDNGLISSLTAMLSKIFFPARKTGILDILRSFIIKNYISVYRPAYTL
jgi:hypothetical protein